MHRQRLTITLDPHLLEAVDARVDDHTLRNRSQAIEHYLVLGLGLRHTQQTIWFPDHPTHTQIEGIISLLQSVQCVALTVALPLSEHGKGHELRAVIANHAPQLETVLVASDFGTGGTLQLARADLSSDFLLLIGQPEVLPSSLVGLLDFHVQANSPISMAINYQHQAEASTIYCLHPSALSSLPVGVSDFHQHCLAPLAKAGKVKGYIY
jgi:hypothetical protein